MSITPSYAKSYPSVIEYLTKPDRQFLSEQMQRTPPLPQELTSFLIAGQWQKLFTDCDREQFPIQSLQLLKDDSITAMQWSTSQLFFNVFHFHNPEEIRFVSVFNGEKADEKAKSMIKATMKVAFTALILQREGMGKQLPSHLTIPKPSDESHWNSQQEETFYNRLWKLYPASEHHFLFVPERRKFFQDNICDRIAFKAGFNALSRFRIQGKQVRMIPSRGMMQAYIDTLSTNPPQPLYRIGLSTIEGMHRALHENYRDLCQSFEPLKYLTPLKVDGLSADPAFAEAELHDLYHQDRAASIPISHRLLFADLADAIKDFSSPDANINCEKEAFRGRLIDLEHDLYNHCKKRQSYDLIIYGKDRKLDRFPDEILFWMSVGSNYVIFLERLGKEIDSPFPEFIDFIADWCILHHEILNEHCKEVVDMLISTNPLPLTDGFFNFYQDLRYSVLIKIQQMLIKMATDDTEELILIKTFLKKAPDTFIKSQLLALVKKWEDSL